MADQRPLPIEGIFDRDGRERKLNRLLEERLRFWELVEEHEPMPNARIQNRLIVELPHQSTPAARIEIMQTFVEPFVAKGLPYHVAIHAPGEKNDARNYHAHVIYSERLAKLMAHPETGAQVWDFTVAETYQKKNRIRKTRHPFRQNRDRDLKDFSYVTNLRSSFAETVNSVMAGIDPTVKFDPRSYKNMGLDIAPMQTINRILHDRMRDGVIVVHNPDWTKRMISAELAAAAQRRDPEMVKLIESAKALQGLRDAWPSVKEINKRLDPLSRMLTLTGFTRKTFRGVIEDRIRIEAEVTKERVMAKAEIAVCQQVAKATKPLKAKAPGRKDARTPEEEIDMDLLHETAVEDLAAAKLRLKEAERTAKLRLKENKARFRAAKASGQQTPRTEVSFADVLFGHSHTHTPIIVAQPVAEPTVATRPAKQAAPATANPIMFEPEDAELEAKIRKRRKALATDRQASAQPQQQPAARRRPSPRIATIESGAAQQPHDQSAAVNKEAMERAAISAALMADVDQAMSAMYDPTLRGQALADSLKPQLDQLYPERDGKHDPASVGDEAARLATGTDAQIPEPQRAAPTRNEPAPDFAFPEPVRPRAPFRIPGREGTPSRPVAVVDVSDAVDKRARRAASATPAADQLAQARTRPSTTMVEQPAPAIIAPTPNVSVPTIAPIALAGASPIQPPARPTIAEQRRPFGRIIGEGNVEGCIYPIRSRPAPKYATPAQRPAPAAPVEPAVTEKRPERREEPSRTQADRIRTERRAAKEAIVAALKAESAPAPKITIETAKLVSATTSEATTEALSTNCETAKRKKRRKAIISRHPSRGRDGPGR